MKILSCNIRYSGADDGQNSWLQRRALCARVIQAQDADVICFQEMQPDQHEWLSDHLRAYDVFAMTDQPAGLNPQNAIYFRRELFTQVSAGGYWLSRTPHVPGTKSWGSDCVRLANWVCLRDRESGALLRVINTHLDHIGQLAREQQAALIVEDSAAYPPTFPQLLTGDFNCDGRNRALAVLRRGGWHDTFAHVHGADDPGHTYHGFQGPSYVSTIGKMDWIMMRGAWRVQSADVIRDGEAGRYPSDHFFVSAEVTLSH